MKYSLHSGIHPLTAIAAAIALFTIKPAFAESLVIDDAYIQANGNLITGDYDGTPTIPAILVTTTAPVIILNSNIETTGDFIVGQGSNDITVINCTAVADNPNVRGMQKGIFLRVTKPVNIAMRNNVIQGVRIGLYLNGYSGNHTHNQTIRVIGNNFLNIDGRPSDGKDGYSASGQYNGQAIHVGNAYSVPDMEYAWNQVVNQPNQSATGAIFEFSESGGTSASPTLIHDNFIQGAYQLLLMYIKTKSFPARIMAWRSPQATIFLLIITGLFPVAIRQQGYFTRCHPIMVPLMARTISIC
jgi:hypothetical protein